MASGPNALLRLLHAAHLEHSQTAGLGGRRAVADLVGGGHLDKRLQFVVQVGLDPVPVDDPAHTDARRCRNIMRPPAHW